MPFADQSQLNRAPDWSAPNLLTNPPNIHPVSFWGFWEPSRSQPTIEVLFSKATNYATQVSPSTVQRGGHFLFWDPSLTQNEVGSFIQSTPLPGTSFSVPASYLLLIDHYLPGGYALAGTTITEGGPYIPFGWIPTPSVDPLTPNAIAKFWAVGPSFLIDAEASRDLTQPGIPLFRKPLVYWQFVSPGTFILTGAGATLGPKSSG